MKINLYNSLSKSVEEFIPLNSQEVTIYSCGPTVYNYAHIGNMRAFIFADTLQRVIRTIGGYKVKWVMNLTNIDDKTIRDSAPGSAAWLIDMGAQTSNPMENLLKLTEFYEKAFLKDIEKLGINIGDFFAMPKATEYLPQMLELITSIYQKGYAYISEGSVYFNVAKWRQDDVYGRLYKIDFDNFLAGARVDADEYERAQASDFALWKAVKEGEPFWDFELDGKSLPGRPGWHIECSAMEYVLLGLPFDIHTGGVDLKFPHHEDEIAQSKAGYGIDPTRYWCHNEFLEVEGRKMSKSFGNFFTLRDLMFKGIDPLDIRFSMLSAHYGSTYNFTFDGMKASRKARFRIQEYIWDLLEDSESIKVADIEKLTEDVLGEIASDLHFPKALGKIFTFINENPAKEFSKESKLLLIEFFKKLNEIFGVWVFEKTDSEAVEIPNEIGKLAEMRWQSKVSRNFAEADRIRKELLEKGWEIKDSKDGFTIIKIEQ